MKSGIHLDLLVFLFCFLFLLDLFWVSTSFKNLFNVFFLSVLSLHCCTWAFSSFSSWGLFFIAVCRFLIVVASCCRAQALGCKDFSSCSTWALEHRCVGLVALWHVESNQIRDKTHVPYLGRHILHHWIIREVLEWGFKAYLWGEPLTLWWYRYQKAIVFPVQIF